MKPLVVVNLIATSLLFVAVSVFGFLMTVQLYKLQPPENTGEQPGAVVQPPAKENAQKQSPRVKAYLLVLRGAKPDMKFPIYEGENYLGRADEKPVDVDLEFLEAPERIWSNRQHAIITYEKAMLFIEDLKSSNGTYVNRNRVHPGKKHPLNANDIIQIGEIQLKVML